MMGNIISLLRDLNQSVKDLDSTVKTRLDTIIQNQQTQNDLLQQVVRGLSDEPAAFRIDVETAQSQGEKEKKMKQQLQGKLKISILDNGTAKATLTPVDSQGLPTTLTQDFGTPAWTSSDPGIVVTPAADGLSATLAPANPPVLVSGASITATATNSTDGSTISGTTTDPISVVAGGPSGFQISVIGQ